MSTLNAAQRAKLPSSAYGDPQRRLYPIVDQDDVDSAKYLVGKARNPEAVRRRITMIARKKGLRVPDAWQGAGEASSRAMPSTERPSGGGMRPAGY